MTVPMPSQSTSPAVAEILALEERRCRAGVAARHEPPLTGKLIHVVRLRGSGE